MSVKHAVTTFDGRVYTHRILFDIAERALKHARSDTRDLDSRITAILFSALAFEAYANVLIEQIDPATFAKEREHFTRRGGYPGLRGKVRWILEKLDATLPEPIEGSRDLVMALLDLRDELAHAKPVTYSGQVRHDVEVAPPWMEPQWIEDRTTLADAELYVDAVARFGEWLVESARPLLSDPHLQRSAFEGTTQWQTFGSRAEDSDD